MNDLMYSVARLNSMKRQQQRPNVLFTSQNVAVPKRAIDSNQFNQVSYKEEFASRPCACERPIKPITQKTCIVRRYPIDTRSADYNNTELIKTQHVVL